MESGSAKSKDGVPTWSGEASTFQDYEEAALLWEQSIAVQKRYLCGPRLAAELSGSARRLVAGKKPSWLSHNGGVTELLQHLRASLGRPQVSELTELLSKYFKGSRKRPTEGMNEYITRKSEVYMRACQALRRVAPHHKKGNGTTARVGSRRSSWDHSAPSDNGLDNAAETDYQTDGQDNMDGASTTATTTGQPHTGWSGQNEWHPYWQNSWWSYGWGSYGGYGASWWQKGNEEVEEPLPELLPDFVQGWYLLIDSGLDQMSRNLVITGLQGDFAFMKVAQELRNQFGEEPRRRDFHKNASYLGDHQEAYEELEEEIYVAEDDHDLNEDGKELWNEAEDTAQEAMAALQVAKKTLKEARNKQHAVKMARQYYKPNFNAGTNRPRSSGAPQRPPDDSQMTCLRCGKVGHRAANCSVPPQSAKVADSNDATSSFVCFSNNEQQALSVGMSTDEAVRNGMAVVDGGATRTLASIPALEHIMKINVKEKGFDGLVGMSLQDRPTFSFGNGTQDQCASTIKLQLDAAEKKGELTVHCLDRGEGPLLLSIDALRRLDAIIDCRNDLICLRALDPKRLIKVQRSQTGHQLLPLTQDIFKDALCAQQPVPSLAEYAQNPH